jgi:hypothetical protein
MKTGQGTGREPACVRIPDWRDDCLRFMLLRWRSGLWLTRSTRAEARGRGQRVFPGRDFGIPCCRPDRNRNQKRISKSHGRVGSGRLVRTRSAEGATTGVRILLGENLPRKWVNAGIGPEVASRCRAEPLIRDGRSSRCPSCIPLSFLGKLRPGQVTRLRNSRKWEKRNSR